MGLNLKKKVKRFTKKLTPKPLRHTVDIAFDFMNPKTATKDTIRAPGKVIKKMMAPKMGKQTVIQETDEELVGLTGKRRTARRRGSRSNSMLSN